MMALEICEGPLLFDLLYNRPSAMQVDWQARVGMLEQIASAMS